VKTYNDPFRHTVIDNYLSPEKVSALNAAWPKAFNKENGKNHIKWAT
jgi:hypothetical protein